MATVKSKISQNQRLEMIREQLLKADAVSIEKLARKFKVSGMTIRRDLDFLESRGDVIRTRGGAALAKRLTFEFAFRDKEKQNQQQKVSIARQAVKHVKDGQVIMLDTGTTTLQIARELVGRRKVKVITTSLAIVSQLQFAAGIEVVLLGGLLRGGSPDIHGPLTEQNVELFKTDIAFMGADAIDADGNTYTDDLRVVTLDQKMASNSKQVIVVADNQKFGHTTMCKVFEGRDYDLIISDSGIDKKTARRLAGNKIDVELA
ncbi:MAG: DeoR/GlpR family DNA-binding transcription regulator [Planctomycetota bacterium]|jgi:DeoR/GlpR family transcriptional regulator of sugar metabolism